MANVNFKKTVEEIGAAYRGSMGGHVTRVDIVSDSGIIVKSYDYASKPVKNMIVQTGIDAFYGYGGSIPPTSNSDMSQTSHLWTGAELPERMSLLRYCARGTGTAPTTRNMTALQNQVGGFTNTYLTSSGLCGSINDASEGTVLNKITYAFPTGTAGTFTEVGFFGYTGADYVMFSRIVLPESITVTATQSMQITYELIIAFPYAEVTRVNDFDLGWGNQPVDVRIAARFQGGTSVGSNDNGLIDSIISNGGSVLPASGNAYFAAGLFSPDILASTGTRRAYSGAHARATRGSFPNVGSVDNISTWGIGGTWQKSPAVQKLPYTNGDNKMTKLLTWLSEIPTSNVGYFNLMGMGVMFAGTLPTKTFSQRLRIWIDISFTFK